MLADSVAVAAVFTVIVVPLMERVTASKAVALYVQDTTRI
jgi:hypothetical protein